MDEMAVVRKELLDMKSQLNQLRNENAQLRKENQWGCVLEQDIAVRRWQGAR